MEFVEGISIDKIDLLKEHKYNLKEISFLLSDCFARQIFKFGVVHADPHSGNIFVRKDKSNQTQIVLLDHGLYKYLPDHVRLTYSYLWKGIIEQDEEQIRSAVHNLGVDDVYYRLFASMLTAKDWDCIMDQDEKSLRKRFEIIINEKTRSLYQLKSQIWMKKIIVCLEEMEGDLLLIFKVNDYLRTINSKLGRPIDTFYYTVVWV